MTTRWRSRNVGELAGSAAETIDMLTVLIVGNETTRVMSRRMVTPRGYGVEDSEAHRALSSQVEALLEQMRSALAQPAED